MTKERIAELKALAAAATGGPWEVGVMNDRPNDYTVFVRDGMECHQGGVILNQLDICRRMDGPNGRNNAEFIAAARDAIPALIAEVEEEAGKVINPAIVRQLADCRARLAEAEERAEELQTRLDELTGTEYPNLSLAYLVGIRTSQRDAWKAEAQMEKECNGILRAERDAARERVRVLEEKAKALADLTAEHVMNPDGTTWHAVECQTIRWKKAENAGPARGTDDFCNCEHADMAQAVRDYRAALEPAP